MIPLFSLIFIICGSTALEEERNFLLDGEIRHFAVASNSVYISTEESLYQLRHDLTLVRSLTQRGVQIPGPEPDIKHFQRVSGGFNTATFRVNVLLPFAENKSLIVCGAIDNDCGYCEVVDLTNISRILHREHIQVGALKRSSSSVSFLVRLEKQKKPIQVDSYILTAIQDALSEEGGDCTIESNTVNLQNLDQRQFGGIFSITDTSGPAKLEARNQLEFVDGFQIKSTIYLLSNAPQSRRVRLFCLEDRRTKTNTLRSLRGADLMPSDGRKGWKLKASSVLAGGESVLLGGVFAVDGGDADTELLVFDISPDLLKGDPLNDPDLYYYYDMDKSRGTPDILRQKAVLLRQSFMTSVLVVRQKEWMVFFIGTGDGQLLKLAVDRNFNSACPKVLYKSNDDRRVFPTMHLDQVDYKHLYMAFTNEIKRVPVSKCSSYRDAGKCWSAQDPHCGWCSSQESCTFEDDCGSSDWLTISNVSKQKVISHSVVKDSSGQLKLNIELHLSVSRDTTFTCQHSTISGELCSRNAPPAQFPQCTCVLTNNTLPAKGLNVTVTMRIGSTDLIERLTLTNCSEITGPPTSALCQQCVQAGCGWSERGCSWAKEGGENDVDCRKLESGMDYQKPEISSITPSVVSFYGRNHAVLSGRNLGDVIAVRIQAESGCAPLDSPVWNNSGTNLTFRIPATNNKGEVKVCAVLPDGGCHGNASLHYKSSPSCSYSLPRQSWISGKRTITIFGSHLEFVEGIVHSNAPLEVRDVKSQNSENLTYETPAASTLGRVSVNLKVANQDVICTQMTYYPDPEFISFTSTLIGDDDVRITIEKKADKLEMTAADLSVWGVHEEKSLQCEMEEKGTSNETDFFICEIKSTSKRKFEEILIKYGDKTISLKKSSWSLLLLLVFLLIPCIAVVAVIVSRKQQRKLNKRMNRFMEDLELDIRNEIRQGFVDLQTDNANLMENVGTIPFLDYKHFASRIFFPESEPLLKLCVKDMGQDAVKVELDAGCQALSRLLQDQVFLTSMVHALEEQKSFNIKDKCALASLLTVALHSDLSYLTQVMEALLKDLMQQSSNVQPKLLLRRTESTVEKLLTNWMSVCLYGFLRESVGQHLFLMVSALTQQISKGPVDCVTEKALYTLSEDWLLWQATDFSSLRLKVLFAVGSDGGVSEPLEVEALSCDTVEQLKDKILSTFKAKFGFPYSTALRDARIEFEKDGSFVPLEEVDAGSEVVGEVTMLNTLKHYKVADGATIKVLSRKSHPPVSPQGSLKDDENFSGKYFHLIDPDVVEDQKKNPERKKLKVKEVHLTKLLSTKVAVHSFVENLFRAIWATSNSKIPHAVKYFFDFLDAQAENMKISDPDVLHIWKTNSLPLRFWINILKNPQFVFDMEKSPHVDGCLSVIAQAFMDSFSLSELQLGKHAPTNKLLYAKDIPNYKKEVKDYYRHIREQPAVTEAQFREFLCEESKKHENEFNEAAALRELYRFIQRYYTEIKEKLDQSGAPAELTEQLQHVKAAFDGLKSCSWD